MELFEKYAFQGIEKEGYDKWVAYYVAKSAIIMYCSWLALQVLERLRVKGYRGVG